MQACLGIKCICYVSMTFFLSYSSFVDDHDLVRSPSTRCQITVEISCIIVTEWSSMQLLVYQHELSSQKYFWFLTIFLVIWRNILFVAFCTDLKHTIATRTSKMLWTSSCRHLLLFAGRLMALHQCNLRITLWFIDLINMQYGLTFATARLSTCCLKPIFRLSKRVNCYWTVVAL